MSDKNGEDMCFGDYMVMPMKSASTNQRLAVIYLSGDLSATVSILARGEANYLQSRVYQSKHLGKLDFEAHGTMAPMMHWTTVIEIRKQPLRNGYPTTSQSLKGS